MNFNLQEKNFLMNKNQKEIFSLLRIFPRENSIFNEKKNYSRENLLEENFHPIIFLRGNFLYWMNKEKFVNFHTKMTFKVHSSF